MAGVLLGRLNWGLTRDADGHRDYSIQWLIETLVTDGPAVAMNCPGLPVIGSTWAFGTDVDSYAWCRPDLSIAAVVTGEPNVLWTADQTFSTKPLRRCQDSSIENPLDEPPDIGGTFSKAMREGYLDQNGDPMVNSSWELIRGTPVEMDEPRPTVTISMNVATLPLADATGAMLNPLNDSTLWGLPARCVKLSNFTFQRKLYGTCTFYYTVTYEFEIRFDTFDPKVLDEGTMVVNGEWNLVTGLWEVKDGASSANPQDFIRYKTPRDGEYATTLLDGDGKPLPAADPPVEITLEKYGESNLLLLGIPTSL